MDFKSHEEVVLPVKNGKKVIQIQKVKPQPGGLSPPREYKRPSEDLILLLSENEHSEALQEEAQAHSPSPTIVCEDEQLEILRAAEATVEVPDTYESFESFHEASEALKQPEFIETKPTSRKKAAKKRSPQSKELDPDSALSSDPSCTDYIFAYHGKFLGHYRSSEKMASRKVFARVAQRLAETIASFDPLKLELFKPSLLKVDRESVSEQLKHESFNLFNDS